MESKQGDIGKKLPQKYQFVQFKRGGKSLRSIVLKNTKTINRVLDIMKCLCRDI
jgi:hypothetical protein